MVIFCHFVESKHIPKYSELRNNLQICKLNIPKSHDCCCVSLKRQAKFIYRKVEIIQMFN